MKTDILLNSFGIQLIMYQPEQELVYAPAIQTAMKLIIIVALQQIIIHHQYTEDIYK